jgi:magnesium transporter
MIQTFQFQPGTGVCPQVPVRKIDELLSEPGHMLWIDVTAPTPNELGQLRRELGLHPLIMEDLTHRSDRPRIEQFEGVYTIVFYALRLLEEEALVSEQINLLVAHNYLLTVHDEPIQELEEVIRRWRENTEMMEPDVGIPVYSLLDTLVDGYFPCIDEINEHVEAMEEQIFQGMSQGALAALFRLKKDLLQFRRIVAPERDVVNVMLRREQPVFSEKSLVYFQDIYDHLVRVTDSIDTYRDLLSTALDMYLSVTSNRLAENSLEMSRQATRLNQTMQVLAAWSIILMSGSLIAGIYGMNFKFMPELNTRYGYYAALAAILLLGTGLAIMFWRKGWLQGSVDRSAPTPLAPDVPTALKGKPPR